MDNIGLGVQLMIVGMSTVFMILLIVIWGGKLLIKVVNKMAPEEVVPTKGTSAPQTVDSNTMAVLQQVVSEITGGKGHVASAKRI